MRLKFLVAAAVSLAPTVATAQTAAPAPVTKPAAKAAYSTAETDVGTLLDDPAAKAVLVKHLPDVVANDQVDMVRSMTLRDVQKFDPEKLTDTKLAAIDADLAKLPAK